MNNKDKTTDNCPQTQQQGNFSTEFLLQIINATSDPIFVKDRQHRWVMLNDAFCCFIGYSRKELIGKSDYDFFPKAEADMFWEKDELVFTTGITNENEEFFTDAQGEKTVISTKKYLLTDEFGNQFLVGTIRDIQAETALKNSERKYRDLVETSQDLIWSIDKSGYLTFVNQAVKNIYGYEPEELIGQHISKLELPEQIQQHKEYFQQFVVAESVFHYEAIHLAKDGRQLNMLFNGIIQRDEAGNILGTTGTATNITERKQAEAELKASQKRLALLIEQTPLCVIEWNTKFEIQEWNPAAERIFGYSKDEVLGRTFDFIVPESAKEQVKQVSIDLLTQQGGNISVNYNRTKDARTIICEWHNSPLVDVDGQLIGVVSMMLDITERKQAEEKLQKQEQFLRTVFDGTENPIFVFDVLENGEFRYVGWNAAAERATGISSKQVIGNTQEFVHGGNEFTPARQSLIKCLETGKSITYEEYFTFQGQQSWWLTTINPLKDIEGRIYRIVATTFNISDRKRVEEQLQQQEQFLRSIYDGVEQLIFVVDVLENGDFCYAGWNSPTENLTGISGTEVVGKSPEDVHGEVQAKDIREKYTRCVATAKSFTFEEYLNFQGQEIWLLTTLNPLKDDLGKVYRIVGTTFDISDRKRAEIKLKQQTQNLEKALQELQQAQLQLIQSEKMSSLGQLVAGVAHEINNPTSFIFGNLAYADQYIKDLLGLLQLYQQYYPNPVPEIQAQIKAIDLDFLIEDLPKLLNSMKMGTERIRQIVLSLRTFSRMDEAETKAVNIHEGIDSTLMILEHRLKDQGDRRAIEVIKEYGNLPLVECYAGQLNQVFMNILANAIDAFDESLVIGHSSLVQDKGQMTNDKGQIHIRTEVIEPNQVSIRIADNGPGIPEEVKQRLFDPFFTTKSVGKGTGMGLSISYQIITEKHGGSLECISQLGSGAEFVITIPLRQQK